MQRTTKSTVPVPEAAVFEGFGEDGGDDETEENETEEEEEEEEEELLDHEESNGESDLEDSHVAAARDRLGSEVVEGFGGFVESDAAVDAMSAPAPMANAEHARLSSTQDSRNQRKPMQRKIKSSFNWGAMKVAAEVAATADL